MPLYDYECEGGHRFEEVHSMDDRHNTSCPVCLKPVRLLISAPRQAKMAHTFTTIGHDGQVIGQKQTTERTSLRSPSGRDY